jgi:crossover junction endodeoxyribonuclease RuvC
LIVVGIDPGLDGAVAVLVDGRLDLVNDTPVIKVLSRRQYDVREMWAKLFNITLRQEGRVYAGIERQRPMPQQGVTSTFNIGHGYGLWTGLVTAFGWPYEIVEASRWKSALLDGMPKEKGSSVIVAKRLFPDSEKILGRKKDHNRADAILIAEYMRRRVA